MDKLQMQTSNMADENFKKLVEIFPNIVTETIDENGNVVRAINKEMLEQEISTKVVDGPKERYEFIWPEKKQSIIAANAPTTNTLRPSVEDSVNFDTTKNLYIEGDNLEVLKILQETYLGKVKMIYIDPPYNTGSDFVYEDDFAEDMNEYMDRSGQFDEEGNRLFVNAESNGRFHTDWLNMMYPRLKMARNLLSDDGVIAISIDDNEQHNLKKICEEIFGIRNIEVAVWNKEAEGSSGTLKQTSTFRRIHEYVIFAYKNRENVQFFKINEALKGRENEFQTANLAINMSNERTDHKNYFTITNPNGDTFTRQWKWSEDEINKLIDEDLIYWGSDGHKQPRLIIPLDDRRRTFLLSILNYGGTTVGRKDFEDIMSKEIEFSYPKPIILLNKLISSITKGNDIILDFFSGSATTAHAVMELNAEDGGSRQFIMVQLQEETDEKSEAYKAGYKNICEIGKERIRRAGAKIKEDFKDQEGIEDLDIGFRVLKVDSSNMEDVYYNPLELQQDILSQMTDNIKADRNDLDLLFQVMLDMGIEISSKIDEFYINNKKCFSVEDDFLIACFDKDIDTDLVKEIAKKKPVYAVILNRNMINDSLLTNFDQIFKEISPDTVRKVL